MGEKTINTFFGQVSDRAGQIQKRIGHFDRLLNVYSDVTRLKKRPGTQKFQEVSHSTGSKTYGLTKIKALSESQFSYVKVVSGTIYVYDSGSQSWRNHTEDTSRPNSRTYFAEMRGEDLYAGAIDIDDTADSGSTTTEIKLTTNTSLVTNILARTIVSVDYGSGKIERKVVIGNTADTLLLSSTDPLNSAPPATTTVHIGDSGLNLYAAGGGEYWKVNPDQCIATISGATMTDGFDRLDNEGAYSYPANGLCEFNNRILTWYGNRFRWSDLSNGDNFGKDAYGEVDGTIWLIKRFNDNIAIIYTTGAIYALIGTTPSNWSLRIITDKEGTNRPEMVDNYTSQAFTMQLYMNGRGQIKGITQESFTVRDREAKTMSLSRNYVQESLAASANYLCAGVSPDGMYLISRSDNTYLALNLEASERLGFKEWVWHEESRPSAITPFCMESMDGFLVGGANASGQLYTFHVPEEVDDDGTAISMEIVKRAINVEQYGDLTKWYGLNIAQGPSGGSTTMSVYAKAGNDYNDAIDSLVQSYDPSAGKKFRRGAIKNNPSANEGTGDHLDFKISESSSVAVADIEAIQMTYFASIIT